MKFRANIYSIPKAPGNLKIFPLDCDKIEGRYFIHLCLLVPNSILMNRDN